MSVTTESIQVENVVASSDIGQELDLETLSEDSGATDYDPDNFPGLVYRMHDPKGAALSLPLGKNRLYGRKKRRRRDDRVGTRLRRTPRVGRRCRYLHRDRNSECCIEWGP